MLVISYPPRSLLPTPPHHTSATAATSGASARLVGPRQTRACCGLPGRAPFPGLQRDGLGGRGAGPAWAHPAPASPHSPYLGPHLVGPPGRPSTCAPAHGDPREPRGPGLAPRHAPPAALTSRSRALPALTPLQDPAGRGRSRPGHAPGLAASIGAESRGLCPRCRRVTDGRSPTLRPGGREAAPPMPGSTDGHLPQTGLGTGQAHGGLITLGTWNTRPRPAREAPCGLAG